MLFTVYVSTGYFVRVTGKYFESKGVAGGGWAGSSCALDFKGGYRQATN